MRPHYILPTVLLALAGVQGALAQQAPAADEPAPSLEESTRRVEQRIEHIHHEDSGSKVDEVRVGGQTKNITVQPKARVPQYEIVPTDGTHAPPAQRQGSESTTGPRVWNVMKF
jgi:hypothetical protein